MAQNSKICRYCKEKFDISQEKYIMPQKGFYYHVDCYIKKYGSTEVETPPPHNVNEKKCLYCGQPVDITKDEWVKPNTTRYAHKKCYEEKRKPGEDLLPDDIYYFLKNEVHLAIDYRLFESQRANMVKKNGYTNAGILQALKYWYQVKHSSPDKANGGIGIVPYIYQDAQNYYKNLAKQQKEISKSIQESLNAPTATVVVNKTPKHEVKNLIDLDDIRKEEEW